MSLAVLTELPAPADLAGRAREGERVVVSGPAGSGRWTLGDRVLSALGPAAIEVALPPFDALDGPLHGLVQLAAGLGQEALEIATDAKLDLALRVREVAKLAAAAKRVVVLRVPASWQGPDKPGTAGRARRESAATRFFEALLEGGGPGAVALIHPAARDLLPRDLPPPVELAAPRLDTPQLDDTSRWGRYAPWFGQVMKTKGVENLTPIQLRLLVGVSALGQSPSDLLPELWGGYGLLTPLLNRLVEQLRRDEHAALRGAVLRFCRSRFSLPRTVALDLAAAPDGHEALFTECLAYSQGDVLRMPDEVRSRLAWGLREGVVNQRARHAPGDAGTHAKLVAYHKALDGADAPPPGRASSFHWLERVYNLGRMGQEGAERWQALSLAGPEQLLDRAWSLSVEFRDFAGAAELYQRRVQEDATDAYAWHYLGFNLQRSRGSREAVEAAYRNAIERDPTNPWWNSRLVTFLIHDLRYRAAEREWQASIGRVDPQEVEVGRRPWLATHLHRWVADAWLEHGEVERARAVFGRIPRHVVSADAKLRDLRERVEDAVEAITLGESVYPSSVRMADRWRAPRVTPEEKDGVALLDWMPGRILQVGSKTVAVVMVEPQDRRVLKQEFRLALWKRWSRTAPQADRFFEIGFYGETEKDVLVTEVRASPPSAELEAGDDDPEDEHPPQSATPQ